MDNVVRRPQVGEDWKTERGYVVRIEEASAPEITQAVYMDIRCGGQIPVWFDMDGNKIGGSRPDRLIGRDRSRGN